MAIDDVASRVRDPALAAESTSQPGPSLCSGPPLPRRGSKPNSARDLQRACHHSRTRRRAWAQARRVCALVELIGRTPTFTELGIFSAMWNEHCSYKSSKIHLRTLPTKAPWVIQGPGENAGVIDIGDGLAVVFKMESHNHPSYIEPYQGAATGVGGILRDVFTMGARPIACLNALSFGDPEPSENAAPGVRRRRRHRRLRQFVRRADGRRRGALPSPLRRQLPGQCHGGGDRRQGQDFLFGGVRRRHADRLSRLENRPRRHPRRQHGLGRVRRRRRGEAPDRAGRRPVLGKAPARSLPRNHGQRLRHRHPGHGGGGFDLLRRRDGRQGRPRRDARSRQGAVPRDRHERLRDDALGEPGAHAHGAQAGKGKGGGGDLPQMGARFRRRRRDHADKAISGPPRRRGHGGSADQGTRRRSAGLRSAFRRDQRQNRRSMRLRSSRRSELPTRWRSLSARRTSAPSAGCSSNTTT